MDRSGASRPLNVQQIVKQAQSFDYNPLVPLRYWLRSAGMLLKEVEKVIPFFRDVADALFTGGNLRAGGQRPTDLPTSI